MSLICPLCQKLDCECSLPVKRMERIRELLPHWLNSIRKHVTGRPPFGNETSRLARYNSGEIHLNNNDAIFNRESGLALSGFQGLASDGEFYAVESIHLEPLNNGKSCRVFIVTSKVNTSNDAPSDLCLICQDNPCICVEQRTAAEWDRILGTRIMDWDGFENRDPSVMMTRAEFEKRAIRATRILDLRGDKGQANTGAVRDKLYPAGVKFPARYDLMFRNAVGMRRLAETYGEGFQKYGADNWMKGFPESVLMSHALEHLRLHGAGDVSEDHLAHAAWNILTLCWVQENKPELLDLTKPEQKV